MRLQAARHGRRSFDRARLSLAWLWCLVATYILIIGTLTILKHQALQTTAFDLGTMDQAIWNTSQGRILEVTIQPGVNIRLAGHVEPVLLVIALFYLLRSDPQVEVVGRACNGSELLRLPTLAVADVVVLDLVMPELGGLSVLPHLTQR